ncbi:MAG: glucose 1-dehydrogenase [Rhodospirillales bacterium]|nr:glucose 1-dehydrogenase [Rhodospirillales bacterium]
MTGGAMGIGRAIVQALLAEGASVVIADRDGAEAAAADPDNAGDRVIGVPCDVSSQSDTEAMANAALEAFGRIDVLVNNAGIYSSLEMTPFEELDVDEWRRVLDVNVVGQALASRAVVPAMRRQGGGSIVNLSSGTPFKGVPFMLHYVASKGAVNAMTKALAKELGAADIRVNAVAPGFTLSDGVRANPHQLEKLQDISRQARVLQRDQHPEDIVGAVVFFASDDSAFVTGQTLVVDGGAYFH